MAGFGFRGVLGTVSIVISVVDRVSRRVEKVGESVLGLDSRVMKMSRGFRNAGMMISAFSAMATAAIAELVTKAMDFWIALKRTGAVAGWTGSQVDEMRLVVTNLAKEYAAFGVSQKEVAEGMYHVASAGIHETEALKKITGLALELKALHGIELPAATDLLTTAMRVFGYEADTIWQAANSMNYAIVNSKLTFDALADTMKYAAPVAKLAGWSFEGLMAGIMAMANAGIRGSKAGTALRAVVTRLAAPPARARKAIRELNIELFNLDESALKIKRNLNAAGVEMERLEESTAETENRIKGLQAVMSRFGIEERKIRLQMSAIRLRAAAEGRTLTEEELQNLKRLELATDGLAYDSEILAIQQEELRMVGDGLNDQLEAVTESEEELTKEFNASKGTMKDLPDLLTTIGNSLIHLSTQERLAAIEAIGGKRAMAGLASMLMAQVPALANAEFQQAMLNVTLAEGTDLATSLIEAEEVLTGKVTEHAEAMLVEAEGTQEASTTTEALTTLVDEKIEAYREFKAIEMETLDAMLESTEAMTSAIEVQMVMARVMQTFHKIIIAVISKLGKFGAILLVLLGPMLIFIGLMWSSIFAAGVWIKKMILMKAITAVKTALTWLGVVANIAYIASIFIIGFAIAAAVMAFVFYIKGMFDSITTTEKATDANWEYAGSMEEMSAAAREAKGSVADQRREVDNLTDSWEAGEHALTGGSLVPSLEKGSIAMKAMEIRASRVSSGYKLLTADILDTEDAMRPIMNTMASGAVRLAPPAGAGRSREVKINKIEVIVNAGPISDRADAKEVGRIIGEEVVEEVRKAIP